MAIDEASKSVFGVCFLAMFVDEFQSLNLKMVLQNNSNFEIR